MSSASARATFAQESLDGLDLRTPVPLLPMMAHHQKQNMRDHLVAVQEIIVAMSTSDYTGVERAASRIGFSDQMGRMCSHMGAGAPGWFESLLAELPEEKRMSVIEAMAALNEAVQSTRIQKP